MGYANLDNKISFTNKRIEKLEPPEGRERAVFRDTWTPYLAVVVYASGKKVFYVNRRIHDKPERVKLGMFPAINVEQARELAQTVNFEVAKGAVADDFRPNRTAKGMTVGGLFAEWLVNYAKAHKKTWQEDERIFNKHLADWRDKPLKEVSRRDIQRLHVTIGKESGKTQANRVLALLSSLFGSAADWEYWEKPNPCKGVKRFPEQARERFIQPDEMEKFMNSLADEENKTVRDFILMALFTGARKSNVLSMRWADVNLGRAVWKVEETKNGRPQLIPLVPEALELLKQRKKKSRSVWVFPSRFGYGKHMTQPNRAFSRVCQRAGLEDLRIHDLRRSLGSWLAMGGKSLLLIGKVLNHKSSVSTAIYARVNLDPIREAMQEAVGSMMKTAANKA